jgi:hypothetical protein
MDTRFSVDVMIKYGFSGTFRLITALTCFRVCGVELWKPPLLGTLIMVTKNSNFPLLVRVWRCF